MVADFDLMRFGNQLHALKVVRLSGCYRVTPKGVRSLVERRKTLTQLDLSAMKGDVDLMVHHVCRSAPDLEVFQLSESSITDASLSLIGRSLHRVRWLALRGCSGISDVGVLSMLASLVSHKTLRRLDLRGCSKLTLTMDRQHVLLPDNAKFSCRSMRGEVIHMHACSLV